MKVAITGANGTVGRALIGELDPAKFDVTALDLPDHDASNLDDLVNASKGHDALVHLAWQGLRDNFQDRTVDPVNTLMTFNAYQAAVTNGVPRVIMGSSNHAHRHDLRDTDERIRASIQPPHPDSPYGAEKVFMEAMGSYFADYHDLDVLCVRIGNVNEKNQPSPPLLPDDPTRWLSYADLGRLVTHYLDAEIKPGNLEIMYGVSKQPVFDWTNSFGYEPQDSAI